jgi:hypothetical protein
MKFILSLCLMFVSSLVLARGKVEPVAHLAISSPKCETPCRIIFNASKSKSTNGQKIIRYIFKFGDGKMLESRTPIVTHTYHSSSFKLTKNNHFKATLVVEDEAGNISKQVFRQIKVYEGESETINNAPLSSFSYFPQKPKAGDTVTLTSLAVNDQEVVAYEWHISDGRVLTGEVVELVFQNPGLYTVIHKVIDAFGLSAEVSNILPVIPNTVNDTLLTDFIGIRTDSFNPKLLNVKVVPTNGTFHIDPEHIVIYLNGLSAKVNSFSFTPQEISFSFEAKDGKNSLSILGLDSKEEAFSADIDFYAGSKSVSVDILGNSPSGRVTYYPLEDKSFKYEATFQNGILNIINIPEADIMLDVLNDANEFAYETLGSQADSMVISLLPNRVTSSIDNDDFSKNAEGWTVSGGVPTIVNKMVKGSPVTADYNLRIYTDSLDDIVISRTFKSKEANRFIRVNFNYLGGEDESLHVVLRNETTKEYIHRIFEGKDNTSDLTTFFDVSKNVTVRSVNVGDIIHLDIKRVFKTHKVSFMNSLSAFMFPSAYAQTYPEENRYVDIDKVFYSQRNIWKSKDEPGFEAHSWYYKHTSDEDANNECIYKADQLRVGIEPLEFLSVGASSANTSYFSHDILTSFFITQFDPFSNELRLRPDRANLYIVQREGTSISKFSKNWEFAIAIKQDAELSDIFEKFTFSTLDIEQFNEKNKLHLVLEVEINGEVFYEELPRKLTPLKWYSHPNLALTGCRDSKVGGALWIHSEAASILDKIFSFVGDLKGFAISDISKLNGGYFPPHAGHKNGLQVDYKTTGIVSGGKTVFANAPEDIHSVLYSGNQLNNVEKILLSLTGKTEIDKGNIHSLPNKIVRARCTANNYPYSDLFEDKKNHVHHGHINFSMNIRKPINHSLFGEFRPYFYTIDGKSFYFEVDSTYSDMNFIWEIRKDDQLVEVLDSQTIEYKEKISPIPLSGMLISKNSNLSEVNYTFPEAGGVYSVHLVAVRKIENSERCMSLSLSLPVLSNIITVPGPMSLMAMDESEDTEPPFCPDEWQTYRGKDIVDPVSGHRHIGGAIVSKNTKFEAGRFLVDAEEVLICGKSEIKDSYTSFEGCPEGQTQEECSSIYIKGIVDAENTVFDARNGKIRIAGLEEAFLGLPLVLPTDSMNGIGLEETETSLTDAIISPSDNLMVILFNVDIFNGAKIHESALIQQSVVGKANIGGQSTVSGGTVYGFEAEGMPSPSLNIGGKSFVEGFIHTTSNIDITESTVSKNGKISGGAIVSKSLVDGTISGNSFHSDERVEMRDSKLLYGSTLMNAAKVLNGSFIGAIGENETNGSLIIDNAVIDNAARVSGHSYLADSAYINGSNIVAKEVYISNNSKLDSTVGGGAREQLLITNSTLVFGAVVTGTPLISESLFAGKVLVSEGPTLTKASFAVSKDLLGNYSGSVTISGTPVIINSGGGTSNGNIVIKDKASVYDSTIADNAKMYDSSMLSGSSFLGGNAVLKGTVHVTNLCSLVFGTWSEGVIEPAEEGSPCWFDPDSNTAAIASRTLASEDPSSTEYMRTFDEGQYTLSKMSSLEKVKSKRPKKIRQKDKRIMRSIRLQEESIEKKILSYVNREKRKPASLQEIEDLHMRSREYVEKLMLDRK